MGFAPTGCVATGACLPLSAPPKFLVYLIFIYLIPNLEPTGRGARSNGWRRYRGVSPSVGPPEILSSFSNFFLTRIQQGVGLAPTGGVATGASLPLSAPPSVVF